MRAIFLLGLAVILSGCRMFGGQETISQWNVLEHADDLKCGKWPLKATDLQTDELIVLGSPEPVLVSTGLKRDASPIHYYAPFHGLSSLDEGDLHLFNLGRGSVALGGGDLQAKKFAAVVNNASNKATLEIRRVQDNVVVHKGDLTDQNVSDGVMQPVPGGGWLRYRRDDNTIQLAYIDLHQPSNISVRPVRSVTFDDMPQILSFSGMPQVLALWKEGSSGRPFKVRFIGQDGTAGPSIGLDFEVESEVESWTASVHNGTAYLAFIDGDSLVGRAKLRVASFAVKDGSAAVTWQKDMKISDVHLSEPVFYSHEDGLMLMLLNWVDEESTIAQYKITGEVIANPKYAGIFPKGSRIMDAFGVDGQGYVIVRHRDDLRWAFHVCRLDS